MDAIDKLCCMISKVCIFALRSGKMYWTDVFADAIYVSDFSGDNVETLVNSQLAVPGT